MLILLFWILAFLAFFYYLEIKRKNKRQRIVENNRKRLEQLFQHLKMPNKQNNA